jgi:hypothetical protein
MKCFAKIHPWEDTAAQCRRVAVYIVVRLVYSVILLSMQRNGIYIQLIKYVSRAYKETRRRIIVLVNWRGLESVIPLLAGGFEPSVRCLNFLKILRFRRTPQKLLNELQGAVWHRTVS